MKSGLAVLIAAGAFLGSSVLPAAADTTEKWSLGGFSHPESVDLDIPHQVLYVSNLNGGPLDKDGNGFISKLSRDGKLLELQRIEGGLKAPKVMVMQGRDARGNFLSTDLHAGALLRINRDGSFETLVDLKTGSADLDVIDKGRTAIVPRMLEDTVTAYSVD